MNSTWLKHNWIKKHSTRGTKIWNHVWQDRCMMPRFYIVEQDFTMRFLYVFRFSYEDGQGRTNLGLPMAIRSGVVGWVNSLRSCGTRSGVLSYDRPRWNYVKQMQSQARRGLLWHVDIRQRIVVDPASPRVALWLHRVWNSGRNLLQKKNPKRGKNRDLTRVLSMEGMADISWPPSAGWICWRLGDDRRPSGAGPARAVGRWLGTDAKLV
jgi:hypothetical protein